MEPQQPMNSMPPMGSMPAPEKKSGAGLKILIALIVLIVLAAVAYFVLANKTNAPTDSTQVKDTTQTQQVKPESADQKELNSLDQENNAQDFSSVDSDFNAEVNAAAQ